MSLTVLSVAFPHAPVGPGAVGGAEQILAALDEGLVRAGHRSIVVAQRGSSVQGTLYEIPDDTGAIDGAARRRAIDRHRAAIARVLAEHDVDVVHLHGLDFHAYLPPGHVAVLATLHLPPSWYAREALEPRANVHLNCVSRSQAAECAALLGRSLNVVENGVAVARLNPSSPASTPYCVALGRICPEKGFHLALEAARHAGMRLLLAGQVFAYEAHERYFRDEILPRLDGSRRFVGPARFERKRRLLARARCLLVPSRVPETSSLVAMEALACGTPVVAFRSGALPEIVEHGVTGFLVDDEREMAEAIDAVAGLDRAACRAAAERRFSVDVMVGRYLGLYARLARARAAA